MISLPQVRLGLIQFEKTVAALKKKCFIKTKSIKTQDLTKFFCDTEEFFNELFPLKQIDREKIDLKNLEILKTIPIVDHCQIVAKFREVQEELLKNFDLILMDLRPILEVVPETLFVNEDVSWFLLEALELWDLTYKCLRVERARNKLTTLKFMSMELSAQTQTKLLETSKLNGYVERVSTEKEILAKHSEKMDEYQKEIDKYSSQLRAFGLDPPIVTYVIAKKD
ncbi:hypothetical protein [Carp edema virus]|nr:hypothetical protein [Carp edema virus]